MLYINNPDYKPLLYSDAVAAAIKAGVQPQRAYIFLASLGVKGALTRQLASDKVSYLKPRKLAINDNGEILRTVKVCSNCGGLKFA